MDRILWNIIRWIFADLANRRINRQLHRCRAGSEIVASVFTCGELIKTANNHFDQRLEHLGVKPSVSVLITYAVLRLFEGPRFIDFPALKLSWLFFGAFPALSWVGRRESTWKKWRMIPLCGSGLQKWQRIGCMDASTTSTQTWFRVSWS